MTTTPPEFIRCKTIGHAWDTIPYIGDRTTFDYLQLRCISCHSERLDTIDVFGTLIGRIYTYSPEYKMLSVQSRSEWRVSFLQSRKLIASRDARRRRALKVAGL